MILVALGSNISGPWGTPRQSVLRAIAEIQKRGVQVLAQSSLLETRPMGPQNQPNYVNAVVLVRSGRAADSLMRMLHLIEKQAGRVRRLRWGPRTLDLDLLDFRGARMGKPTKRPRALVLPHPGIADRTFVLAPIAEIAPRWRHPITGHTAAFMLRQLYRLNKG
jgi:2-amino-4-hydroxy-6-hydroxymethyldihydropteridine diphosphokinase